MKHHLLRLLSFEPRLLIDHADAYAELVACDAGAASHTFKRQAVLIAAALCSLGVGAVLSSVALMLCAVVQRDDLPTLWPLVVVPALPLVLGALCWIAARRHPAGGAFDNVWRQLRVDVAMLRDVEALWARQGASCRAQPHRASLCRG